MKIKQPNNQMDLLNEFMNPNSVLRQGRVVSHTLGFRPAETNIQKLLNPRTLQEMCSAAYKMYKGKTPPSKIGDFILRDATPTMLLYWNQPSSIYVVAVRGTVGTFGVSEDWQANSTIPFNGLSKTDRWMKDDATMKKWLNGWITPNAAVYATGHSLGGAICDELLRHGYVKEAFTFNPAVQSQDFNGKLLNNRVYARGDPLYQLMGQFTVGSKLLPAPTFLDELLHQASTIAPLYSVPYTLDQHALTAFNRSPDELLGSSRRSRNGMGAEIGRRRVRKEDPREQSLKLLQGGVKEVHLNDAIEYLIRTSSDLVPEKVDETLQNVLLTCYKLLKSATTGETRRIHEFMDEISEVKASYATLETNRQREARIHIVIRPLLNRFTDFFYGLRSEEGLEKMGHPGRDLVADQLRQEQRERQRLPEQLSAKANLGRIKIGKEVKEEAEEELERGSPIKSPKKGFGLSGGVTNDHLEEALGYYEMKMPEAYSVENLNQAMKVIQTVIKYIGRSATYDEKRRLQTYYDFVKEELDAYDELNPKEKKQRFTLTVKRLNDFTRFLYSLKPPASEDPKKNLISDEIIEDADVKRRIAEHEVRLQRKKEAEEHLKKGKGRGDPPFPYSREGLTPAEKARERAAYYRKNPAESSNNKKKEAAKASEDRLKEEQRKKAASNKVKWAQEAEEAEARKKDIEVDDLKKPLDEKQASLADRAKLSRAKATLRKGIVRRLFKKKAEITLWITLYKKGRYFNTPELSKKEEEAYKTGRGIFSKADYAKLTDQYWDISKGKWQDYLPQSTYDRISKQVEKLKARDEEDYKKALEEGPSPDRSKKLPNPEEHLGLVKMKTPNGYEWYMDEKGNVYDERHVNVGNKGMNAFKNLRGLGRR